MCCIQIASRVCRIFNIENFFSFIPDLISSVKPVIRFGVTFGYPALLCIQIISHAIATHGVFPFFFNNGKNGFTQGITFQFRNCTQHIGLPVYCDKPSFKIGIFMFDIGLAFKICLFILQAILYFVCFINNRKIHISGYRIGDILPFGSSNDSQPIQLVL